MDKTITIFGREDTGDTTDRGGVFERVESFLYGRGEVNVEDLQKRLNGFLEAMKEIVQGLPGTLGDFSVDTVTLAAEISAKGQVSLLGTGGEVAGKGGLTFTLKRRDQQVPPVSDEK